MKKVVIAHVAKNKTITINRCTDSGNNNKFIQTCGEQRYYTKSATVFTNALNALIVIGPKS